ncbi:Nitroreductase NfnB [Zhongshania aliphaticivorans]|uniref:Nitroreductase NfnB n=1 Tax=Zhongshania aliphaticivorans TaxID=1470434 RepID=A0A5S9Q1N9_9GAMM|nr:nitroreductase family protein [Zhongshania aliphaticivorans]CAA0093423.1 Nitroreductase NfnB [Zhongshania aliphaticivorans]CAA0111346.1 Nitroreductase NfnB [Zhongshania aliphaticivorans]
MSVRQLLTSRSSTRGFLDKPVADEVLHQIFSDAQQSPSNCNTQPWKTHVISGEKKDALSALLVTEVMSGKPPSPDFDWTVSYQGDHRERQFGSASALYGALGIERQDKQARGAAMIKNWQFFGAPHAVFFTMEKYLNIMGAVDLGIYAQSLALLLAEQGIGCCMQGALGQFPAPVREFLSLSDSEGVLFGMSFGYPDPDAAINQAKTDRVSLDTAVNFVA